MTFQAAVKTCLTQFATFSGRAGRAEFWWFYLFTVLVHLVIQTVGPAISLEAARTINSVVALALFLPLLAVGSRRLHDVDRSGWWQLLILTLIGILLLLYWWAQPSQKGTNLYGAPART